MKEENTLSVFKRAVSESMPRASWDRDTEESDHEYAMQKQATSKKFPHLSSLHTADDAKNAAWSAWNHLQKYEKHLSSEHVKSLTDYAHNADALHKAKRRKMTREDVQIEEESRSSLLAKVHTILEGRGRPRKDGSSISDEENTLSVFKRAVSESKFNIKSNKATADTHPYHLRASRSDTGVHKAIKRFKDGTSAAKHVEKLEASGKWPEGHDAILMHSKTNRKWQYTDKWEPLKEDRLIDTIINKIINEGRGRPRKDGSSISDEDVADGHILMQLRKVVSLRGQKPVKFGNGETYGIHPKHAYNALNKYANLKKADDKESFVKKIGQSRGSFFTAMQEDYEMTEKYWNRELLKFLNEDLISESNIGALSTKKAAPPNSNPSSASRHRGYTDVASGHPYHKDYDSWEKAHQVNYELGRQQAALVKYHMKKVPAWNPALNWNKHRMKHLSHLSKDLYDLNQQHVHGK